MSKRTQLASTALLALGLGAPALAQTTPPAPATDAESAETIIVTVQKREQALIDVPINISVATQDTLDLLGTDDIEEFAAFVPGLEVSAQSLAIPSYNLRGVTSDIGRPRVALFENGVAIGDPRFAASRAMFDLERIEVVKGPQATLFGQGALVGGVNFLQNRASFAGNEGWAKLNGGDYSYLRAEAGYNLAISDTFAIRAAGLKKSRDGYVDNVSGPDLMGQDTEALRLVTAWRPIDSIRADLFLNYEEDASTGTQFKSGVFAPPGGDTSPYTYTANNVIPEQWRDQLGADRQIFSTALNVAWDINDAWRLTSLTGQQSLENLDAADADGAWFSVLQLAGDENAQVWSQELRLNYDSGPISAFVGANWQRSDYSYQFRFAGDESRLQAYLAPQIAAGAGLTVAQVEGLLAQAGVPGAANFDNMVNPLPYSALYLLTARRLVPLGRHAEETFSNTDQTSTDIFGDITWQATERLSLTAGLRYTWDEIDADALVSLLKGNPTLGGTRNAVTGGTTLVAKDSLGVPSARSYDTNGEPTWRFNAAYRVSEDLNTWASVGRGRRAPSLSRRTCAVPACDATTASTGFEVIDQETYDNIEIGASGVALDNRLRFTASTYYGEYKDFQTTHFEISQGGFITENSGNATTYGLELEGQLKATDFLNLLGSYAWTFAEYDANDDSGKPQAYAGNRFRLSPENSLSLAADFHVPTSLGEISFVPAYSWRDDQFFEDDNDPNEFQKAYGLLDLKIAFDANGGRWGASLYVQNATDEEYLIDAGNTGGEFGIPTYIRGVPRMAGAGIYLKF